MIGGTLPVRYLSDAELARLNSWPADIAEHPAVTFFTPTDDDRVRGSTLGLSAGLAGRPARRGVVVYLLGFTSARSGE